jgi:putative membrane protein
MNFISTLSLADTWGMHGDDVGWGWMMIPMVLFWGAVILGIVWLARGGFGSSREGRRESSIDRQTPIDILDRRFAEGTISVEEYRERRDVIAGGTRRGEGDAGAPPEGSGTSEGTEA